jgi:hypothetical protein
MTTQQENALKDCAQFVKDILKAIENDEGYTDKDLFEIGLKLLRNLSESGILLEDEQ